MVWKISNTLVTSQRCFPNFSCNNYSSSPNKVPANSSQPPKTPGGDKIIPGDVRTIPTALDKKYLVWSGRFKSAEEIPKQLESHVIHRARSWGRIRMNLIFLFLAGLGGAAMVYSGKKAAARGETVESQNLEWHRQINEDYQKGKK